VGAVLGSKRCTHDRHDLQPRQLLTEERHRALVYLNGRHVWVLLEQLPRECPWPRPQFNHLLAVGTVVLETAHLGRE